MDVEEEKGNLRIGDRKEDCVFLARRDEEGGKPVRAHDFCF